MKYLVCSGVNRFGRVRDNRLGCTLRLILRGFYFLGIWSYWVSFFFFSEEKLEKGINKRIKIFYFNIIIL